MSRINQHIRLFFPTVLINLKRNELFQFFFFIYPHLSDKIHIKDIIGKVEEISLSLKCCVLLNHVI